MQGFFASWAVSVTVAVIFSAIIHSLLPETSIKKYITVVLGVVVTIFMLSPLFKFFGGVDIKSEMDTALDGMKQTSEYRYEWAPYRDYIFKVYMGDE